MKCDSPETDFLGDITASLPATSSACGDITASLPEFPSKQDTDGGLGSPRTDGGTSSDTESIINKERLNYT